MKSSAVIFVVLACTGLVLMGIGSAVMPQSKEAGVLVGLVGLILMGVGSGFLASSKGRSPASDAGLLGSGLNI